MKNVKLLIGGNGEYNKKTYEKKYIDVHDFHNDNYLGFFSCNSDCNGFLFFK